MNGRGDVSPAVHNHELSNFHMVQIERKSGGLTLSAHQIARWIVAKENIMTASNAKTTKPICDFGLWIQARFKVRGNWPTTSMTSRAKRDELINTRIKQLRADYRLVENIHEEVGLRYSYNNVSFQNSSVRLIGIPDIGCTNGGTLVETPHMRDLAEHYDKCEVIRDSDRGRVDRYEASLIEGICGLHEHTELRYYEMESGEPVFRHEVLSPCWETDSKEAANAACRLVSGRRPHSCNTCYLCEAIMSLPWWKVPLFGW